MSVARRWLDTPLSGAACVVGWFLASAVFLGVVALLGGPTLADARESLYSTWAIQHGRMACAYPPVSSLTKVLPVEFQISAHAPPLWPLISGALASLTGIGHGVAFPKQNAFGAHCGTASMAMYVWAVSSGAVKGTLELGYASWFALLGGVVALLRATGRGRCGWEVAGAMLLAVTPVVWFPLLEFFHPQDLLALGLVLGGAACALRGRWIWAGALLGLAVTAQQFALLALLPVLVVAPSRARSRLGAAAVVAWGAVSLPVVALTSGGALRAVVFGTGDAGTAGGTVLWETGLRGPALTVCARVVPLLAAVALAWWVRRRLGPRALVPAPFVSLVALCLGFRVVFEEGLFGYKLLALGVMLVVLALMAGRVSGGLVVWLTVAMLAFDPVPVGLVLDGRSWGSNAVIGLKLISILVLSLVTIWGYRRWRIPAYAVPGLVLVVAVCAVWPPVTSTHLAALPKWFWQTVLVGSALVMVGGPLLAELRAVAAPAAPAGLVADAERHRVLAD